MSYLLTPLAQADIQSLGEEAAARSTSDAAILMEQLHRRFQLLSEFPRSGVARDDIRPRMRIITSGDLLILYRIRDRFGDEDVEIIRISPAQRLTGAIGLF
ncbi:type II toxin-antitoxin system RelE/ParE family toxin [Oleisolibacter albus]|uniref:type II toxin-antitoxin system RelE/ParE family toxin n=1 Tax=Oleisolibacter albus TaxID=2171757 RepID=UPI0013901485|nr:type II toxin-antitoxin system RelE/ParE family toxin [Oleisolibacter albus]